MEGGSKRLHAVLEASKRFIGRLRHAPRFIRQILGMALRQFAYEGYTLGMCSSGFSSFLVVRGGLLCGLAHQQPGRLILHVGDGAFIRLGCYRSKPDCEIAKALRVLLNREPRLIQHDTLGSQLRFEHRHGIRQGFIGSGQPGKGFGDPLHSGDHVNPLRDHFAEATEPFDVLLQPCAQLPPGERASSHGYGRAQPGKRTRRRDARQAQRGEPRLHCG